MEFGQNKFREIDLFDFMGFFLAWTFFNFLAHYVALLIYFVFGLLLYKKAFGPEKSALTSFIELAL